jgi:PAS domain S-box-containing protein
MKPKVLIIDDEETILNALSRILGRSMYEVYLASSPEKGMHIIQNSVIDVVISDIMMEGLSGIDLIKWVNQNTPDIPVILITGNPDLTTAKEAVQYKAFDYIQKPVERTKILEVLKKAIEFRHLTEKNKQNFYETIRRVENLTKRNQDLNYQNSIILDTTVDCVITVRPNSEIFSINRSTRERFATVDMPIVGEHISVLYPPKYEKILNRIFYIIINQNTISPRRNSAEIVLLDNKGKEISCDVSICKYRIGDETFYTGIIRDISERKMLTQKLIESEKISFLNSIASSIGHEINNSLTAIMGFIELAIQPNADLSLKDKAIGIAYSQGQKLRNLTYNLLTLGKSKEGWDASPDDRTELNSCLDEVLEVFEKSNRLKRCDLQVQKHPSSLPIQGNKEKIGLIISNLILNSADATNNTGRISIHSYIDKGEPCISIEDNGMGMSQEVLDKLYEPYFTTKPVGKGTGLGMFVVREISRLYGIKYAVDSKPGVGTKFTLRFHKA